MSDSFWTRSGRAVLLGLIAVVCVCVIVAFWIGVRQYKLREQHRLIESLIGWYNHQSTGGSAKADRDPLEKKGGFDKVKAYHVRGDQHAMAILVQALDDEDPEVRDVAARTLGCTGDIHVVPYLLDRLHQEKDPWVREILVESLHDCNHPDVIAALFKATEDSNPYVREEAIICLQNMNCQVASAALIRVAKEAKGRGPVFEDAYESAIKSARIWIRREKEIVGGCEKDLESISTIPGSRGDPGGSRGTGPG